MAMWEKERYSSSADFKTLNSTLVDTVNLFVNREETKDGSLNWRGRPAIKGHTSGWSCRIMSLLNQGRITIAFSKSSQYVQWQLEAFLSDSYMGRFNSCVIFQVVSTTGLLAASLCTYLFFLKPQWCGKVRGLCKTHSPIEVELFCISIYLVARVWSP
ncbi:hypothetical protein CRG98_012203 [Punica granatum]|uniref:Uncharacterized protein n=1 Tax=Punica granatum TaxID=22663 RepID=A0A2I0KG11_PUNGR|nr:hypothetical protein CRG98_012203 [Punica granatum]